MIGVGGYLCLDIFPAFRPDALAFHPGMLYEVGPARFAAGGAVGNTGGALARLGPQNQPLLMQPWPKFGQVNKVLDKSSSMSLVSH